MAARNGPTPAQLQAYWDQGHRPQVARLRAGVGLLVGTAVLVGVRSVVPSIVSAFGEGLAVAGRGLASQGPGAEARRLSELAAPIRDVLGPAWVVGAALPVLVLGASLVSGRLALALVGPKAARGRRRRRSSGAGSGVGSVLGLSPMGRALMALVALALALAVASGGAASGARAVDASPSGMGDLVWRWSVLLLGTGGSLALVTGLVELRRGRARLGERAAQMREPSGGSGRRRTFAR